jgi:uncharacterized membrane protein
VLLFFIGFFPFSSSLITQVQGGLAGFFIYFLIIFLCLLAQYFLYHYVIITRPEITVKLNRREHLAELKKRKLSIFGFFISAILAFITYKLISDPLLKPLATMWIVVYSVTYAVMAKKINKSLATGVNTVENNANEKN